MDEKLLDRLAELEHKQWCELVRWMLACLDSPEREAHLARWRRQIVTPYADLPEAERESDRREARRWLEAVEAALRGEP